MRIALALIATVLLGGMTIEPAQAQSQSRWCAEYGKGHGGRNCGFATFRQCQAALSGNGGFCVRSYYEQRRDRWR